MYPIEIEKEKASSIVRESKQPPEKGGFVAAEISPVPNETFTTVENEG